ncbi:MAG: hypothetical protein GF331_19935 [Chitinivibrionales bacterium]|nr:hypothetical protein [Chitinivibrionales bacterium]
MQTISPAKEIRGKTILPPNPDLLPLVAATAVASRSSITIADLPDTPAVADTAALFSPRLAAERDGDTLRLSPAESDGQIVLQLTDLYSRGYVVFTLLGAGESVRVEGMTDARLAGWTALARRARCGLEAETVDNGTTVLSLTSSVDSAVPSDGISPDELQPLIGLAVGKGWRIETTVDYTVATPLRHLLQGFGYSFEVRGSERQNDPIARRIQRMKGKSAKSGPSFTIAADFTARPSGPVDVSLPGDDILGAALLAAKTLVQRGNLVIENMPLESWATGALQLIRRMGCSPAIQETGTTSFGQVGMVQLQRFNPAGRKVECTPLYQYAKQLPSMVVIALFAEGESVFRGLSELRDDTPDAIGRVVSFLETIGSHHGEVFPDGIVLKGASQYDGFDVSESLPAHFAGPWCMAGLKCIGASAVEDAEILRRWPQLGEMLSTICVPRAKGKA